MEITDVQKFVNRTAAMYGTFNQRAYNHSEHHRCAAKICLFSR